MLQSWLPDYQNRVNDAISRYFIDTYADKSVRVEWEFVSALRHAVEWGGKRLRPILSMLVYEEITWEKCTDEILDGLIGIEFMHCYTLVHDDLPCMDNDVLRRGSPTVWKQYGETMAILVGDALQTMAFERISIFENIKIVREFADALGPKWVVLGQVRDTLGDQRGYQVDDVMRMHDEKTGGFIASCLVIGALVWGIEENTWDSFRQFGILLGRAFQVRDDILDREGETIHTGKTTQKDVEQNKWLVSLVGMEKTKKILENISTDLDNCLKNWENEKFREIKEYVVNREK